MRRIICVTALVAVSVGLAVAARAQAPRLAMLAQLDSGAWDVKPRTDEEQAVRICLGDGRELIQLKHLRLTCNPVVVEDAEDAVTVQYSCPGNGFGRTHVRRETNRLVQINTQGIAKGLPFAFDAEARWVGPCSR